MERASAVVMGDLSLIRCLGRHGIPVIAALSGDAGSVGRSRYVSATLRLHGLGDPRTDATNLELLRAFARSSTRRPILFYQGDDDLLFVSRHREALARDFDFVLPDAALVEATVDKAGFAALAERAGLPVPSTIVLGRGSVRADAAGKAMTYPAVLKPAHRHGWFGSALQRDQLGSNQKAIGIASAGELERYLPHLEAHDTDFILQACVAGPEANIVSYHAYVRATGELAGEFTGRKLRTYPYVYGLSTAVEITDDDYVRELGRDVMRRLGFAAGVVKLDFKRDQHTGQTSLLEVNPRFTLWNHPGALAGVDLPKLVYDDLVGTPAPPQLQARAGVRWMSAKADLKAFLEGRPQELSFGGWLWQLATADVREDLSLTDPLPSAADLGELVLRRLRRTLRRRERQPAT